MNSNGFVSTGSTYAQPGDPQPTVDELLADPHFLVHADPSEVIALSRRAVGEAARLSAAVYRTSFPRHRAAAPSVRRDVLAVDAARWGAGMLSDRLAEVPDENGEPAPFAPTWATGARLDGAALWIARAGHHERGTEQSFQALAAGVVEGRAVVTAASHGETGWTWDALTGELIARPHFPGVYVEALEYLEVDGKPSLVVGGYRRGVRRSRSTIQHMDPISGLPVGAPARGHASRIKALATTVLNGRAIAIAGSEDGTAQAWDSLAQCPFGPRFHRHTGSVVSAATATLNGSTVAVTGDCHGVVRVWDPEEGREVCESLRASNRPLDSLAVFVLDGRPVVITGSSISSVNLYDLETGELIRELLPAGLLAGRSLALAELAGRPIVVAGSYGGRVRVLDPTTGDALCDPLLTHHLSFVASVAAIDVDGVPIVIAAAGYDSSGVHAWDLTAACDGREAKRPRPFLGRPTAVSVDESHGGSIFVAGHVGGIKAFGPEPGIRSYVSVVDLADGTRLRTPIEIKNTGGGPVVVTRIVGEPLAVTVTDDYRTPSLVRLSDGAPMPTSFTPTSPARRHRGPISAIATGYLHDRPIALTGGHRNEARVWYLDDGAMCGATMGRGSAGRAAVEVAVIATLRARAVAVTAGPHLEGGVHVWWVSSGRQVCRPEIGSGRVHAIALADLDDTPIAVTAGDDRLVHVWSLATGKPVRAALSGHTAPIRAAATMLGGERTIVATGGEDRTVRLWDLDHERQLCRFDLPDEVTILASTSDGRLVVAFGQDVAVFTPQLDGKP
ncbi:WD40 repeat domain-containing protein [Embleya sp. NPDC001921]